MRLVWINDGRLRVVKQNSYKNNKRAKRNFRNELNDEHDCYMSGVFKDIDESSECDARLFWKLIRRLKPRSSHTYHVFVYNDEQFDVPPVFLLQLQSINIAEEKTNYYLDFLSAVEKR